MTLTNRLGPFAAAVLLMTPLTAFADPHPDAFEQMQNPKKLLRGAELTEAQLTAIRELRKGQWAQEMARHAKERAAWDAFDDKFTSTGTIDVAELTALAKEGQQLRDEGEDEKLTIMFQMRALLTAEQLRHVSDTHQRMKTLKAQIDACAPTVAGEAAP